MRLWVAMIQREVVYITVCDLTLITNELLQISFKQFSFGFRTFKAGLRIEQGQLLFVNVVIDVEISFPVDGVLDPCQIEKLLNTEGML